MKRIALLFSVFLTGCELLDPLPQPINPPPMSLHNGAEKVQITESSPSDDDEIIGSVYGLDGVGCGYYGYRGNTDRAIIDLKNKTFIMGGDYVQLISVTEPAEKNDCFDNQYVISGRAYKKVQGDISPPPKTKKTDKTKKLRELKALFDDGILSQREYEKNKTKLLEDGF